MVCHLCTIIVVTWATLELNYIITSFVEVFEKSLNMLVEIPNIGNKFDTKFDGMVILYSHIFYTTK